MGNEGSGCRVRAEPSSLHARLCSSCQRVLAAVAPVNASVVHDQHDYREAIPVALVAGCKQSALGARR
jgi:hypothetical protein